MSPQGADLRPLVEDDPRSVPDISLSRQEVDFLVNRLFELLEPELRRMVTEMTRDVGKQGAV